MNLMQWMGWRWIKNNELEEEGTKTKDGMKNEINTMNGMRNK